jgi:Xaa-Pro aminopeptidase
MNYAARLNLLRRHLKKLKCEALAVTHLTNVRYLTGFTGTSGMVLVTQDGAHYFITDFRYRGQAMQQTGEHAEVVIADKGLWKEAARLVKKRRISLVGFEAEHTSVAVWEEVKKQLAPAETVPLKRAVEDMRLFKDADEVAVIREAIRIGDETFARVLSTLRPGLTEMEVALQIESTIREMGGQGTSFETIVASGSRSALPHGVASEKVLEKGDMVTIDMGARFNGYCSDMTRTVVLGKATSRQKEIYSLTHKAQTTAAAALRPGLGCKDADAVARKVIEEAGYAEEFGHGLGHGVGMDIHEQPRLSKLGKGSLRAGMVVTCEPGVYLPEWGGVRIEDMMLITPEGAEILTGTAKPSRLLEI